MGDIRKKVLITGGSGLIGSELSQLLLERNYEVVLLSRNPKKTGKGITAYKWDIGKRYIDPEAFAGTNFIVHLAGADVAEKRWTESRKKEILNSRVNSAGLLYQYLKENPHSVEAFISPSGISYYGLETGQQKLTEESDPGDDFLAEVTKAWEQSADKIAALGIRTVKLRIGIALSGKGGALAALAKPVKFGIAAPLGSGNQIMSWIHISDLCNMIIFAMENDHLKGTFNAVAPNPVSNKTFTKEIAKTLKMPNFFPPVPGFMLRAMLGEKASIVLEGADVSSRKIEAAGFSFAYPELKAALHNLLNNKKN